MQLTPPRAALAIVLALSSAFSTYACSNAASSTTTTGGAASDAGTAGIAATAGTGPSAGGAAGAGIGGQPSAAGATALGGAGSSFGGAGSGGTSGAAGTGAGAGAAGTSGAGGAAANPKDAAKVLDGFALLKPCVEPNFKGCCCQETADTENQHITKQFGGDPNVTYDVTLRIAGVSERYWYAGGELDPVGKLFYTGGLPTIHSAQAPNSNLKPGSGACKIHPPETDGQFKLPFTVPQEIRPEDGCYNGFNVFAMTVSTPSGKQAYYLNYTTAFDNVDRQPHAAYKNDYTVTIPIRGQAQLDFYTIDGDHHQVAGDGVMQVPNVKTAQPYNGNFLEFTVVDVALKP